MTKESTPSPPATESAPVSRDHNPPSLPASPLAKRPKPNTTQDTDTMASNPSSALPLFVKKLTDAATPPTRGSAFAAGYDLYSAKETLIPARGKALVDTGIAVAVPVGCCMCLPGFSWCPLANGLDGRVAPRSGLAAKHSIDVGAGVIDADYRGELKVLLFNLSDVDFTVGAGERVAQLVLERVRCSLFPALFVIFLGRCADRI